MRFTTILHHVYNLDALRKAYFALKRDASPGVDGETWRHYGEGLEGNLLDLSERLKRGAYRAKPVRRAYIPKADGRQRPLGVTALEDKVVQRATVDVMNAIYETDFLGFSYGFRAKRSQHNALDALYAGVLTKKVNWVLDLDIRGFFGAIDHEWLVKFVEHRIADTRVVRLIQKWLNAGVLEDGVRAWSETGTPQGGSASPLLANVYLHYAFDLWAHNWRRKQGRDARRIYVGMAHPESALAVLGALGFTAPESLGPGEGGVGIGTIMLDFGPGGVLGWLAGLVDAQFADAVSPFDVEARALRTATGTVPLTKLEFGVMKYLDAHPGRVVTRDELLQNVWEQSFGGSNVVDAAVKSLRRKLGPLGSALETVIGHGYRFTGFPLRPVQTAP